MKDVLSGVGRRDLFKAGAAVVVAATLDNLGVGQLLGPDGNTVISAPIQSAEPVVELDKQSEQLADQLKQQIQRNKGSRRFGLLHPSIALAQVVKPTAFEHWGPMDKSAGGYWNQPQF